jgi:hypothetical protein
MHKGVTISYCDYLNKVHVKNISKRMGKANTFIINHLSLDNKSDKVIEEYDDDPPSFYTYDNIDSSYSGNSVFAVLSKNIKYIVKPKDKLSHTISQSLDGICANNGLVFKNSKTHIDTNLSDRTKYYTEHTGYELDETFINMDNKISGLSTLGINLEKNMQLLKLINVGDAVLFKTKVLDYVDLTGKYILKSSDLKFLKTGDWQPTARVNLIRTNKTI